MAAALQEKKIKSADRVLEIFEMFSMDRQTVTVMEVARELRAPQSSTSELLSCLVRRGYLAKDRGTRLFRATSRVALLGAWVHPALFRHGNLLPMMDRLADASGCGVILGSRVGVTLQHIHAVGDLPSALASGASRHLLHSPLGQVLISTLFSDELRLIVHRLNSESPPEDHVVLSDIRTAVGEISRRGVAAGEVASGLSAVAVLLPQTLGEEQLSLGMVCPTGEIDSRKEELTRILRRAVCEEVGMRLASVRTVEQEEPRLLRTG